MRLLTSRAVARPFPKPGRIPPEPGPGEDAGLAPGGPRAAEPRQVQSGGGLVPRFATSEGRAFVSRAREPFCPRCEGRGETPQAWCGGLLSFFKDVFWGRLWVEPRLQGREVKFGTGKAFRDFFMLRQLLLLRVRMASPLCETRIGLRYKRVSAGMPCPSGQSC